MRHFDPQTFEFCRRRVSVFNAAHPWVSMNDQEILDSCRLVKRDSTGNIEGYNYAALMLFGTEDAFAEFLPGCNDYRGILHNGREHLV